MTFSSAVMFWNSRMFWKVRVIPSLANQVRLLAADRLALKNVRVPCVGV